jgi:hypothetical protein
MMSWKPEKLAATLNQVTGYDVIEGYKSIVQHWSDQYTSRLDSLSRVKTDYSRIVQERLETQRDINHLLQR